MNRRAFQASLDTAIARARRNDTSGALIYVDLDNFKAINDNYGHETGDSILSEVAQILSSSSRTYDLVARIGGDEFVVWLDGGRLVDGGGSGGGGGGGMAPGICVPWADWVFVSSCEIVASCALMFFCACSSNWFMACLNAEIRASPGFSLFLIDISMILVVSSCFSWAEDCLIFSSKSFIHMAFGSAVEIVSTAVCFFRSSFGELSTFFFKSRSQTLPEGFLDGAIGLHCWTPGRNRPIKNTILGEMIDFFVLSWA